MNPMPAPHRPSLMAPARLLAAAALLLLAAAAPAQQPGDGEEARIVEEILVAAAEIADAEGHGAAYEYLAAQGPFSQHSTVMDAQAYYAWQDGRLEAAEELYRTLIEREPDSPWHLNSLGYMMADSNYKVDESLELLARALRLAPDTPEILDSYGWALYRLGDLPGAFEFVEEALDHYGYDGAPAEIMAHYGELLWETGEAERAVQMWQAAWRVNPEDPYLNATIARYADSYPVR